MTYTWTDRHGDRLTASAETLVDGSTVVSLEIQDGIDVCIVHVPLDRLEELVAGLRDTARQAAGNAP